MKHIFARIRSIFSGKRGRTIMIAIGVSAVLWALFAQEKDRISFVEPKKPLYKVEDSDFDAIEYVEDAVDTVADFIVDEEDLTPSPVISSPGVVLDSYYSTSDSVSGEASFDELKPLQGELPIVLQNIPSDSGLDVGARISNPYYTDQDILIIEITGPNYYTQKPTDLNNPNVVAFRDGFLAVKAELATYGVDLAKTRFNLGDRGHQMLIATKWLNFLRLVP